MEMEEGNSLSGPRFRRVPRNLWNENSNHDPLLNENLEQWPHLNELVQCYKADWIKDDFKYGHFDSISPPFFHNQIFEGPDTDIETELQLANARHSEDNFPSTSGRNTSDNHCGISPLPAYEPAFDWENERSLIFGQRNPENIPSNNNSGLKITVKVLSLSFQAGLIEPFYGTICLYNRERREKLSEDFYFRISPDDKNVLKERKGIFSVDSSPSSSVCLMVQLEKPATEENGITSSVYSRKDPAQLTEREKQKLQTWSKIMPYKEPFAWALIPLFETNINSNSINNNGELLASSSPSNSPLTNNSNEGIVETRINLEGKFEKYASNSGGGSVIVEVSNLNKVKECYTEDSLQDPKRKVHKPVKAILRLEIEKLHTINDSDDLSEGGSLVNETQTLETNNENFSAFDFRTMIKCEPFNQLFHYLYIYPLTINLSRKRNLFIKIELRKDDSDPKKPPLEAMYSRDSSVPYLQKYSQTQIAIGTRTASYHDEIKINLPAILTPQIHVLFTFYHIDLQMKIEPPKPVIVGYSVLPLSSHIQLQSDISLPIMRELIPNYLQDGVKERMDCLEDGKNVFRLKTRLNSSLFPINERIRDFFLEFDRHSLRTSQPWGSELLEAINSLKNVESYALVQFLQPILNMLLRLIGDGGETLQVAAFRAMVNILTRVQQESSDGSERNKYLVNYVDFAFNDFGGRQSPVYPGLSTVWGSLARSKAKGYRVGPVYDDVLSMAWFFLELIVKSMGLEQYKHSSNNIPLGEEGPPLQLKEPVFRCVTQLYDCLLTEVHDRCKKGLGLAKRLNSTLAFFCYDLLSVIEPRHVFELVSLYMDKFAGVCQSVLHDCKLTFLQIICDHDLFVEMPGRDPSDRNYLSSVLIQEIFLTLDHDDLSQRTKAARILVVLMCKHEFDSRYQKIEDKLYIAQLYFPLIGQILDEMPVFYNLNPIEKREVLIVMLQTIRNLDDDSLFKAWKQSIARTRLFFKLLEESLLHFEHNKASDVILMGNACNRSPDTERPSSPKYSDRLSPAVNSYLSEASRQEIRQNGTPENAYLWTRMSSTSPQLNSPNQPYSLREALAQAQSSRIGATNRALREGLHPVLRQKLELWEENLSTAVSLQVLEMVSKFSEASFSRSISTDYSKLDCITSVFTSLLSRSQPLSFFRAFVPVFERVFRDHGAVLTARENDRFLKQVAFHLLRLGVFRNEQVRKRAVVGLQILVRNSFHNNGHTTRLRVMLTITLSELMSEVQVTQMRPDGSLEESGEAKRLRKSLTEMADENISVGNLKECGLSVNALNEMNDGLNGGEDGVNALNEGKWDWGEVRKLSECLLRALDAGLEHALLGTTSITTQDRYAQAEGFHRLASAYSAVPDLRIMWLLHLCDLHQEMQAWAEAAQCAVAVAGVIMQALVGRNDSIWTQAHVSELRKICPCISDDISTEAFAAEVEGYGASKLTVDSAVKYLQLANRLFSQAELFHFCASIQELVIPVYKSRRVYTQLAKCHTFLTGIYESIVEQEQSPIPFIDATYYRVGFYGEKFGKLDKKEYVFREPRDVRLGDIMEKLSHIYETKENGDDRSLLHIIPDSRQVKSEELQIGVCYLQITAVDPVMEDEDLTSRRERNTNILSSLSTNPKRSRVFSQFLFDTPFTKNGKTQGGLEDQWKRRTVLKTSGAFPSLVNRLEVLKSEIMEFSPVENAIGMIETRTSALRNELEEPKSNEGDQLPRLQSLQRILQGSVAVQVNSGVLSVCTAFLSGEPATRLRSQELQQLIAALLEFMAVCKRAIRVHFRLIGEEDQEFHTQLVNGFQSLTAELSHYIPAILSEL